MYIYNIVHYLIARASTTLHLFSYPFFVFGQRLTWQTETNANCQLFVLKILSSSVILTCFSMHFTHRPGMVEFCLFRSRCLFCIKMELFSLQSWDRTQRNNWVQCVLLEHVAWLSQIQFIGLYRPSTVNSLLF